MKILIVEDQRRLGQFLKRSLTERSYTATWVQTCREARDALCETGYDAIILDLGLPDGDGLDLLKEWRKGGFQEPVLILSARDAVADRIKGLDVGADDYLAKPFSLEELLARVDALARRRHEAKDPLIRLGEVLIDTAQKTVSCAGKPVELARREYMVLEYLALRRGQSVSREDLEQHVYDNRKEIEAISEHIAEFSLAGIKHLDKVCLG